MAEKLVIKLVSEKEVQEQTKPKRYYAVIVMLLIGGFLGGLGAEIKNAIWPKLPESLTPVEAARVLKGQQGFAGYSLIKTEGEGGIGHDIYCPHCGSPIAEVRVAFLAERKPEVGSRIALLEDFARRAIIDEATAASKKPIKVSVKSEPVVAYKGDTK